MKHQSSAWSLNDAWILRVSVKSFASLEKVVCVYIAKGVQIIIIVALSY